jgi:hypothetical protein
MQQTSCSPDRSSASQEITEPRVWIPFTRVHHMSPYRCFNMRFDTVVPSNPRFCNLYLTLCFPTTTPYAFLLSPKRTTCPAHHILLGLKCHVIVAENYWMRSSYFLNFLQIHTTSSFWCPYIFFSTQNSNNRSPFDRFKWKRPNFTPMQWKRQNYISLYFNVHTLN